MEKMGNKNNFHGIYIFATYLEEIETLKQVLLDKNI